MVSFLKGIKDIINLKENKKLIVIKNNKV